MYRSWKCTFSAITPSYHDPSLSNGFTDTNAPSVRHLRAIITAIVVCAIWDMAFTVFLLFFFFFSHTCTGSMSRDTPTQQSIDRGQSHGSKMSVLYPESTALRVEKLQEGYISHKVPLLPLFIILYFMFDSFQSKIIQWPLEFTN